jgi:hypothetical protein
VSHLFMCVCYVCMQVPELCPRVVVLLKRALYDNDDEVGAVLIGGCCCLFLGGVQAGSRAYLTYLCLLFSVFSFEQRSSKLNPQPETPRTVGNCYKHSML